MKKKKETWNLKQILTVVKDIYTVESSQDSWGVPVVYEKIFLENLKKRLRKIKQFTP